MTVLLFGPPVVETPDLENDIQLLFYPDSGITLDEISEIVSEQDAKTRGRLQVIAERLEFVHHLLSLRQLLEEAKGKQEIILTRRINDSQLLVNVKTRIEFHGRRYDGVDYDIDALCFYLLLTCIESVFESSTKNIEDWLVENWDELCEDGEQPAECITRVKAKFYTKHGYGYRFKKAFTDEISDDLKQRLATDFAVVKTRDGKVSEDSWEAWNDRSSKRKIASIAGFFYGQVRSKFTHTGQRMFFPSIPLDFLPANKNLEGKAHKIMVSLKLPEDASLLDLLQEVVVQLVRKHLLKTKQVTERG